ncbi:MAG: hypothetical protein R3B84_17850 [Zavarzinella sp.]
MLPTNRIWLLMMLLVGLIWQLTPQSAHGDEASPTLAELHQQYKKLGLPLPPKGSKLVRYNCPDKFYEAVEQKPLYTLAIQVPSTSNDMLPTIIFRTLKFECQKNDIVEILPEIKKIKSFENDLGKNDSLIYAIQCHELGLNKLAKYFFKEFTNNPSGCPLSLIAWEHCFNLLIHPTIDRKPIYQQMLHLLNQSKDLDTLENRQLLKSLELSLKPSIAKPGSVEALIDKLVDYNEITGGEGRFSPNEFYLQIACLGFEAIPMLIKHLDDERLTRSRDFRLHRQPIEMTTWKVRDIVCDLLSDLSGWRLPRETKSGEVVEGEWRHSGYRLNKAVVDQWWKETSKKNEEDYMAEFVLPSANKDREFFELNRVLLYVIQKKYPLRLPEIYRNLLEKRPEVESSLIAEAVLQSKLSDKEKVKIYSIAARHRQFDHRYDALSALSQMDHQGQFDKLFLDTVAEFPVSTAKRTAFPQLISISSLAVNSKNPDTLTTFIKILSECPSFFRISLLRELGESAMVRRWSDNGSLQYIPQRLRLFQALLQDQEIPTSEVPPEYSVEKIEVRNHAALQIAAVLKIKTRLNATSTPKQWAKFREKMNQAAELELKKK